MYPQSPLPSSTHLPAYCEVRQRARIGSKVRGHGGRWCVPSPSLQTRGTTSSHGETLGIWGFSLGRVSRLLDGSSLTCEREVAGIVRPRGGVAARAPNRSASHGGSGEGAAGCVSKRRRAARACSSPRPYVRRYGGASTSGTGKARVALCVVVSEGQSIGIKLLLARGIPPGWLRFLFGELYHSLGCLGESE